ncbi:MAG: hypothetical protein PHU49_10985 [Syntrophorhabdaceae bacterium]|nr:hypothetical protein [Syntrophorhabdaceae bacterium]MDD5244526.1 hypothetical protein [Syntrophorhabdaceae bacterium]
MRVFLLIFLLFPCSLYALWPVSWEFNDEQWLLGPLVTYQSKEDEAHVVLRPFLSSYDSDDGGVYRYIYPLGKVSKEKSYFIPIYSSRRSEKASDTAFTLLFYGTSEKGDYFGFFPLFGKMYNRFRKDELGFAAWPLYSYTRSEGATKTNVVWPVFSFYGGTEEGFKVWPLYGTRDQPGIGNQQFALWPFIFWGEKNLDTDEPVDSFYFIPFYMKSTTKNKAWYSVLWPFFQYARDKDKEKWTILWPIFSSTSGEENKGFSFFPLYSREEKGRDRRTSVLWPIYRESEWYVNDQRFLRKSFLVIDRYIEDDTGVFYNFWPVFEYEEKKADSVFLFPSILPFRDRGLTRIVKPLITLYEYRTKENRTMTNFLYGLYTREEDGENWKVRFAFLLELRKDADGTGFELLSGLFGIDSQQVKILFIPFKRGASVEPAGEQTASPLPAQ